jgi:hypothetical protein
MDRKNRELLKAFLLIAMSCSLLGSMILASGMYITNDLDAESLVLDLGVTRQARKLPFEFVLRNPTTHLARILDVRPNCGCAVFSPHETSLLPHGTESLKGTFDTGSNRGIIRKEILVIYRLGGEEHSLLLALTTTVIPDFETNTSRIVFTSDKQSAVIEVTSTTSAPVELATAESTSPAVSATIEPPGGDLTRLMINVHLDRSRWSESDSNSQPLFVIAAKAGGQVHRIRLPISVE